MWNWRPGPPSAAPCSIWRKPTRETDDMLNSLDQQILDPGALKRRAFLRRMGVGVGAAALQSLLLQDQSLAAPAPQRSFSAGLPGFPHHAPRAKRVIFLCMAGGPSHLETFDYKPTL